MTSPEHFLNLIVDLCLIYDIVLTVSEVKGKTI